MDFRISSLMSGLIYIETNYFAHSTALGVFYAFLFINEGLVDFNKSVYLPLNRTNSLNYTLFNALSPGKYSIFAYDIESSGVLNEGESYPAFIQHNITVFNRSGIIRGKETY